MYCSGRTLITAAILSFLPACGSKPERLPATLAFVPFDYLGPAPDSEWIGRAASLIVAAQTSSVGTAAIREAQNNRTRYTVQGHVSGQPGALRIVAIVRDEQDQRTLRTLHARGANVLEAGSALARQISNKSEPYTSTNSEAVRELVSGKPEAALAIDPRYGAAHIAHIETLLRAGRRDEARAAIASAGQANLSEIERANLRMLAAQDPEQRAQVLLAAARVAGHDLGLWRSAADAALAVKNHRGAIEAFKKAAEIDPENIAIWNTLAYAQAFAGDVEASKRSIAEYRKLQPGAANAHDSMGEIYFYEGRFREAEQEFVKAFELDKAFLGGGGVYRAALASFLAGDRAKADAHFQRYLAIRKQGNDTFSVLREAVWLYTTGQGSDARRKAEAANIPAAKAQLAIWDAVEGKGAISFGDRPEMTGWKLLAARRYPEAVDYWRKIYDSNSVINGNDARVLLAWALQDAGRQDESRALLAKWPLPPAGAEPGFSSVMLAKAIELKAAGR